MININKLNILAAFFGKKLTDNQMMVMEDAIRKFASDQKTFDAAIEHCIESKKFFPTINEIKEAYFEVKKQSWFNSKNKESKNARELWEVATDGNPYSKVMKAAREKWVNDKIPFNQTYYDLGYFDLIDEYASPPKGMAFVAIGVDVLDSIKLPQKVFALCDMEDNVIQVIKPINIEEKDWSEYERKIARIKNKKVEVTPF